MGNDGEIKRIEFLDGLRGLAILLVIFFHAFVRWPNIVPYGSSYSDFIFFKYGYLGVELFFLISGFVILMSLEKNKHFFSIYLQKMVEIISSNVNCYIFNLYYLKLLI